MNPGVEKGYALDFGSVIRHVATQMEVARVNGRAASIEAMAETYDHPIPGDLSRVRQHHGLDSNTEAVRFLVEQAVGHLDGRVVQVDGGYQLASPLRGMRYPPRSGPKGQIAPVENPHALLRDPFNPQSGRFSDNIRKVTGKDSMDELRDSMRAFGWIEQLPAIKDERGVVIAGHRRLAVAAELGIAPVVKTVVFGEGDVADARRLRLAMASNLGAKPFTPEERQRIAEYLYSDREWTMVRIAEALNVSTQTVSNDLSNVGKVRAGRPRKSIFSPDHTLTMTDEQQAAAIAVLDRGGSTGAAAKAAGVSDIPIRRLIERERGRREVLESDAQTATTQTCTCPTCGNTHLRVME